MSSDCAVTEVEDFTSESNRDDNIETEENSREKSKNTDETSENGENFIGGNTTSFTELENLIRILKKGIEKKEPGIKYIKYPVLLVEALEELNSMIGMDRVKESVALQTVRLIENLKNGEKSPKMLNTILYGPAGVGKTATGLKLAKIWFALGFLSPNGETTTVKKKTIYEGGEGSGYLSILFFIVVFLGTYILSALSYAYDKLGLLWLAIILILLLVIVYLAYNNSETITKYIKKETIVDNNLKNVSERDIISVVSRNDFVADYLGQTSGKTKKLLEENIGKVLFIDEAYSLLNDPRDAYGYECLNTLNLFLSENPDKIVVIFAGYKEHMKNSIFMAQPGLERRCMWTFNIDPYNGEELADIFFLQAEADGWTISTDDKVKIKRLICRNEKVFKNFGGDCGRLVYLSSLDVSKTNLSSISETFLSTEPSKSKETKKVLTYKNVESGLTTLQENQFA